MGSGSSKQKPVKKTTVPSNAYDDDSDTENLDGSQTKSSKHVLPFQENTNRKNFHTTRKDVSRRSTKDYTWPLPPDPVYLVFEITDNRDSDLFAMPPISPRIDSPRDSYVSVTTIRAKQTEEVKPSTEWHQQLDSQVVGSAHVQSQLSARFEASYNISTADNLEMVMNGLKKTHQNLDENLKRRLVKISINAEKKIALVVEGAQSEQRRLLLYDRECQEIQEKLYEEWLQKYVVKLNEWRSKQLANLQSELMVYQQQIIEISRSKIERINEEANDLKTHVLEEEKRAATKRTTELTGRIYEIDTDGSILLGSESKAEVNLRIQANVGTK